MAGYLYRGIIKVKQINRCGVCKAVVAFVLILMAATGISGCNNAPVATPSPPPAPTITTSGPTPSLTPTLTKPVPAQTPGVSVTPTVKAEISIISNEVTINFPDEITFSVRAKSTAVINSITLEYGSDQRVLAPEISSSKAVFTEAKEVNTSWTWLMKKTGSIPPGATIWWSWKIKNSDGTVVKSEEKSTVYTDTRFTWHNKSFLEYDIYWHDQDDSLINELLDSVQTGLDRIQLDVQIPEERKIKVYIYTSSEELRDAVLFEQEWTGALAYPSFNIVLTAVNSGNLEWAKGALPHEITHLLVGEYVFGPFGDIPTWLNEGLAIYSEISHSSELKPHLDKAIANDTLLPISTLAGSFPTSSTGAYLAYAESASIVEFLIEEYGWDNMRLLLEMFKGGATYDKALLEVYSFDVNGLEAEWREYIGAS
jgi:hypothetical protein